MDLNVLIVFNELVDSISPKDVNCNIERIINELPEGVESVSVLADFELSSIEGLNLSIIYDDFLAKNLMRKLLGLLKTQSASRLLVLDGNEVALSHEQLGYFLDHSNRLPQMTVVATLAGQEQPFPVLISTRAVDDIERFIETGGESLQEWLAQTVYMEGELSNSMDE